ncbi:MAG: 1-acyl-sn-glycerol-3-phosphate acyltransferase [Lachnospiraceae bacterium]|nr:1-acyl-sn-glycerol-3-phosphate acyltransferase [Lachnospiraceae bacterium]
MILLITTILTLVLYFIITSPLLIVLELMRLRNPVLVSKIAQPVVKAGFSAVLFCAGTRVVKLGLENVPKDTPVMFAANHRGLLDAALAYASLPVVTGIVSKKELRKIPFLSWWMDLCNCFFLDRKDPRSGLKMILKSIDNVNAGVSMFIAPEGTRSKTRDMNPFKEGSFKISTKSGCPIVPVAISGSDDIFENSKPFVKRATAVIEYGKPIYLKDLSEEELKFVGAYTQKIVGTMLEGHEKYLFKNPSRKAERKAAALKETIEK